MMSRELTDSTSNIVIAAVFEKCIGHFSALLASSLRKESSLFRHLSVTIQFSQPYNKTGITQVSMMDLVDWGLRSP